MGLDAELGAPGSERGRRGPAGLAGLGRGRANNDRGVCFPLPPCRAVAFRAALAQATTATALRRQLGLLDTAQATVHALARTLPASCQGELLFWRWHLDLVRREARRRLRRLSRRLRVK